MIIKNHLQVPIDQIIHFKVFVIVSKWIEKGFCHLSHQVSLSDSNASMSKNKKISYLDPSQITDKLYECEDGNVNIWEEVL